MNNGAAAPRALRFDRLSRLQAVAANVGVVIGLVLVFVEVRQNAELTRTAMEQHKNDLLADIELSLRRPEMASVWVKSIRPPETLTDADIRMNESHLVAVMLQWDYMFQMEVSGLTSRAHAHQPIVNSAPYYFGSGFARNWWQLRRLAGAVRP